MSLKKIEQVKSDKGFKIWDLIIYGIIIVAVVVLFIVVFSVRDTSPLSGIQLKVVNEVIYEYDFEKGQISINEDYIEITEEDADKIILKVKFSDGGYNIVQIGKSGSVKVTSANCGRQDCIYTPEITDNSGMIYCSPHNLKITPYDFDFDDGNIIL